MIISYSTLFDKSSTSTASSTDEQPTHVVQCVEIDYRKHSEITMQIFYLFITLLILVFISKLDVH